jgi:hypothetical protein
MTERTPKARWSKRVVRTAAWTTAAAAFISALGAIGAAPTPAAAARGASGKPVRQKIIVRRIIKKIVIVDPAGPAPVQVITTGGGTAPAPAGAPAPAPAPAPPPPTTGGS